MSRHDKDAGRTQIELLDIAKWSGAFQRALSEQNNHCELPNCTGTPVALLRLDLQGVEHLSAVCMSHREPNEEIVRILATVTSLRRSLRDRHPRSTARVLPDRSSYLAAMVERLSAPSEYVYIIYAGPIPFHPTWYHDIRDGRTHQPNMDRLVADIIAERKCEVRLIIGNFDRYWVKMPELLDVSLIPALQSGTLQQIDSFWPDAENSPIKVCCLDTTLYDLPTVFDDSVIRAGRPSPLIAISSGILMTDRELVEWEKGAFERLFDAAYRGNDQERRVLERIIRKGTQGTSTTDEGAAVE
jgi:hypothetical protein